MLCFYFLVKGRVVQLKGAGRIEYIVLSLSLVLRFLSKGIIIAIFSPEL